MKRLWMAWAAGAALATATAAWAQDGVAIEGASTGEGGGVRLLWQAEPGTTYRVMGTESLTDGAWERRSGNVRTEGWILEETLPVTSRVSFWRVETVDQAGPEFVFVSPERNAIAVAATTTVRVAVGDPSGVDASSLAIYVDDVRHGVGEPGVEWSDGELSWTGVLGEAGAEVKVWATGADSLGNVASSEDSVLVVERAPELATASEIMISGTQGARPATASAGPAAMRDGGSIRVTAVTDGGLEFEYAGANPLAAGQLWASEDPDRIFYRRILAWEETAPGALRAETEDATLADFFAGGCFSSDDEGWAEYDAEDSAPLAKRRLVRPRIGGETARTFATNGTIAAFALPTNVPLRFVGNLGTWDVQAGFSVAADFGILKRKFNSCDLAFNGSVHVHLNPRLEATTNAAYTNTFRKTLANVKKTFGGAIGPVPVWVDLALELPLEVQVGAQATNASVEATIDIRRALDYHWQLADDAWRQVGAGNPGWTVAETNFEYEVEGSAGIRVSLKPELTVKVYSLVGAYGWVEPYLECDALGQLRGHGLAAPDFYYRVRAYAGLNAEIGLASAIWDDDWGTPPHKTFSPLRMELLHLEGTNTAPSIVEAPADYAAEKGETVILSVLADGTPPLRYSWTHNGVDTGRRDAFLTLTAGSAKAGRYEVTVANGYGSAKASATVTVTTNLPMVGTWRFLYQWADQPGISYEYLARFYEDGSMHDTSPSDYWWDWHLNGSVFRMETREKWGGACAVYRGTRKTAEYLSGTMTAPDGREGTWSMQWASADPDAVVRARSVRRAPSTGLDPAGQAFGK